MFLSYCHVLWWFCHCYLYFDKMALRKICFHRKQDEEQNILKRWFWQYFKEFCLTMIHQNIQFLIYLQTNKKIQMKFVLVINNTSSILTNTSFSCNLQHKNLLRCGEFQTMWFAKTMPCLNWLKVISLY